MAIIDLQRRLTEAGRIRIGQQVPTSSGKGKRPEKLTTFRLTSTDRVRIEQAAQLYGGAPAEWDAPAGKQWEVVTDADALNVIVPPSDMAFSQWYEQWSGGGCLRRCDGRYDSISDGPCVCDPDERECKIHTRLSVMLADLAGIGLWRIDTSGWYAALELQGAVEVLQHAAGIGRMLPARLRLEQRMVKRTGQTVRRFAVPVLDVEVSPAQLLDGNTRVQAPELPQRGVDGAAPLTPVPQSLPERPVASIEQQATTPWTRRKSTQQAIPETGLAPRTVEQAAAGEEPVRMSTLAQQRKLAILLDEAGVADRDEKLRYLAEQFGRKFTSSKQLTRDEISSLIDFLESSGQPDPDQPESDGAQA